MSVLSASAPVSAIAAVASTRPTLSSLYTSAAVASLVNPAAPPVLHRTAQPISVDEFTDALRAAAPCRFPHARAVHARRVALAISGGVDSMALAYLCSQMRPRQGHRSVCVADAPIHGFNALIVDHGLRDGSAAEAAAVAKQMNKMGIRPYVLGMKWPDAASKATTTALETNARRLRYRLLGQKLAVLRVVSLLLAHHEDDQYETVLMRLLSGYGLHGGIRGLRGMHAANDLPECYGIYGAHRSGFWADQAESSPYVQLDPSRRERRQIRADLLSGIDDTVLADEIRAGSDEGGGWSRLPSENNTHSSKRAAPLSPMDTEDLGVMAYRPLLPFSKDRLVATCTANGVAWFEDHTNADATLTLRNALRHMVRRHTLPTALQKPAILQLAARSDATARRHEAEARQLVAKHGMITEFSPNVGTLAVRLPRLAVYVRARPWQTRATAAHAAAAVEKRRHHMRTLAALSVRLLLSYVTPDNSVTPVSQLQAVVDTLFPALASQSQTQGAGAAKGFCVCGVQFAPQPSTPRAWSLSRAPHPMPTLHGVLAASARMPLHTGALASLPQNAKSLPFAAFPAVALPLRWDKAAADWPWSRWGHWALYDGRFWIRLRTRLPVVASLQPFGRDDSKPFRDALARAHAADRPDSTAAKGSQLTRFQHMLKAHAPGKVRYTLPGIYVASDIGWALRGDAYWPAGLAISDNSDDERRHALDEWERSCRDREQQQWAAPDRPTQYLLALPTIGVHVPGLDQWVEWEVRYKKVDTGLLEASQRLWDGY